MFSLFKHPSVCRECGVYFEAAPRNERRWGDLCKTHRAPVMELDRRKDVVVAWATHNWEKLEPQVKMEEEEHRAQCAAMMHAGIRAMAAAQQQANSNLGIGAGLMGNIGGMGPN